MLYKSTTLKKAHNTLVSFQLNKLERWEEKQNLTLKLIQFNKKITNVLLAVMMAGSL